MLDSLRQKMESQPSSSMPIDGSATSAGQSITLPPMQPEVQLPVTIENKANPPDTSTAQEPSSRSESNAPEDWRSQPICESVKAQNALTALLTRTYIIQKKYGEQADHVKVRDDEFQRKLGHFCFNEVERAFEVYTNRRNDIPSPSDIINILEPPPPIFKEAMFISIKQKSKWAYITSDEWNYCSGYEQQELAKLEPWERHVERVRSMPPDHLQLTYRPEDDESGEV